MATRLNLETPIRFHKPFLLFLLLSSFGFCAEEIVPPLPGGMLLLPSGQFYMGRDHSMRRDEIPRHLVKISQFFLDETLVTFKDFQMFVEKTGYRTTAEKKGFGMVAKEGMADWKWQKVYGANWRKPFGNELKPQFSMMDDYPVVSVSWDDAVAYCSWLGKRLPTEAEWEYAARAGKNDSRFPWGDEPRRPDGKMGLNFWQGETHQKNNGSDGYIYMSPVKAFPPNAFGMYDPSGNVWQWTADWWSADYFSKISAREGIQDPKGPKSGDKKVMRGGSWWCSAKTCSGYGLFYRGKTKSDAVLNNNGFRCVKDLSNSRGKDK
jgi:sulfatase modifying factor 1